MTGRYEERALDSPVRLRSSFKALEGSNKYAGRWGTCTPDIRGAVQTQTISEKRGVTPEEISGGEGT